ncbi:MAG TPA: nitroreductase family deazaflavin-dependent oxidoreductase [Candidatus Binatia bacterium]|nr:nitroreductase family deazaflavin-dependent oxidoreductase [Candidatus Binatia bacterium]
MTIPNQSTLTLTHYGRRSGKPFTVKIWFADIDGQLWIGSLDRERNWVKNLEASGKAKVDFGKGPIDWNFEPVTDAEGIARFRAAIAQKHPVMSRIIHLLVRGGRSYATFRERRKD